MVMAWRKSVADEPHNLWEQLGQANVRYLHALSHLIELGRSTETAEVEVYDAALQPAPTPVERCCVTSATTRRLQLSPPS